MNLFIVITYRALEAMCMPRVPNGFYPAVTSTNGHHTSSTLDAEHIFVTRFTVRHSTINVEALATDLLAATITSEVVRMIGLTDSLNTWLKRNQG